MNRFQKFLELSGIAAGQRQSAAERASYFVWYHMRATGEPEADLELVEAYLKESGTPVPDLHDLYQELTSPRQLVTRAPIPGRLRLSNANVFDGEYRAAVFESKGLAPLFFRRSFGGGLLRIGSIKDRLKYWPQRGWLPAWLMFIVGVLGFVVGIAALA
jgi:hypothetical protein